MADEVVLACQCSARVSLSIACSVAGNGGTYQPEMEVIPSQAVGLAVPAHTGLIGETLAPPAPILQN